MPNVRSSFPGTTPDLDLALPPLGAEAFEALRTLETVMMGPGDLDAFQQRLNAWRTTLRLDPLFREDRLSDVTTCLVMGLLEPHRSQVPLERLGRALDALLAEGAMLDHVPPTDGDYLLSRVTGSGHPARWPVAQLLLERGASPLQQRNSRAPWFHALGEREETFVRTAMKQNMVPQERLHDALYHLISGHNAPEGTEQRPLVPVALALLDAGASLDASLHEAGSPFVMAASFGYLDLAQALLDQGADRHATRAAYRPMDNDQGWTALHLVAAEDNPEVCRWLVAHGLDPQARSFNRATPLDVAREHDAHRAVAVLEQVALRQVLSADVDAPPQGPGDPADRTARSRPRL